MLGLLGTSWLEIGQSSVAIEGALEKVSRVLPLRARERLKAISSHLFFFSLQQEARPDVSLTDTPTGVLFQGKYDDVDSMARYMMVLNLPFVVHQPAELREALLRLAEQMVQSATVSLAG